MTAEAKFFYFIAGFFAVTASAYAWATASFAPDGLEPMGVTCMGLSCLLGLMVAFYLTMTARGLPLRPEDNPAAHISDQEGEYGFFSPGSWWPLPLAAAAAIVFLGLAVGWWLFSLGAVLGVWALIGWVFQYFKGAHAL